MPSAVDGVPSPGAMVALRGFAGKIPARGDFVGAGLPRDFLDPWNDWQSRVIAGSRALMGDTWLEAFLEAPVWRFHLAAGVCGPRAAIGLLMPSVDKVGRYFPLTFAALPAAEGHTLERDPADWDRWLDTAEALGRLALDEDAPPERLVPPPCPALPPVAPEATCLWWTEGGPRVTPIRATQTAMPDAPGFAAMLGHPASTESA